jgi:hypothetical protein
VRYSSTRWSAAVIATTALLVTGVAAAFSGASAVRSPAATGATGGWHGDSSWIGGTSQYSSGEWVAQDFVYDDASLADNAADIVELRVRPEGNDLLARITLNTLRATDSPVVGIAVGGGAPHAWPDGAGISSPWTTFVTATVTQGQGSVRTTGSDGTITTAPATVDLEKNTVELRIAGAASTGAALLNAATGTWDAATRTWAADPGVVDLAFNREDQEPVGKNWRDTAQRAAITAGDVTAFGAVVDVLKLRSKTTEPYVPGAGTHNRIYRTIQSLGEGFGDSFPAYRGLYQPYSLYLPTGWRPGQVRPLTLVMHSLNNWHNEFNATDAYPELAERRGAIAITPLALGVDGWYWDEALVDSLQVWRDVRTNYRIDEDRTSIGGYSMGGYATYRLTTMLPDHFAAAAMWAGVPAYEIWPYPAEPVPTGDRTAPGKTYDQLENTEHIPFLVAHGTNDELVPVAGVVAQTERMHALGHEYEFDLHPGQDHFTFTALDDFSAQGVWLRDHPQRVRAPGHVGFKVRPWSWSTTPIATGVPKPGIVDEITRLGYDLRSAYWVSGVQVVGGADPVGVVDLTSHAVELRTPVVQERLGAGVFGSSPHTVRGLVRTETPAAVENVLSGSLTGVTELTVDLAATGLRLADLRLDVAADRPVVLHLRDGASCRSMTLSPDGPPVAGEACR